jgi:EpsI family protein
MSQSIRWRAPLAAILVLCMGNIVVWQVPRASGMTRPADSGGSVPLQVGPWQGKAAEVDPRAIEILETPDVLVREYRRSDEPAVWLARVSGFGQRAAFHPPELCYVGSHFEVLERRRITVRINAAPYRLMRLVIGRDGQQIEAWYWFTAGGRVTPNYYQQQLWLLGSTLRGKKASGTLVRLSTVLDDPKASHERLAEFLESYQYYLLNSGSLL